jgi:hypothetical protein
MNDNVMDEFIDSRLESIKQVLSIKAKEYARNGDRLHNFNVGAQLENVPRERILHNFWLKHYISYLDILNDIDDNKLPTESYVDEKLGDMINYLILQEASIKEKIRNQING